MLSRRQFIHLGTGAAVTAALYGCSDTARGSEPISTGAPTAGSPSPSASSTTEATSTTSSATSTTTAGVAEPSGRTLVVVQLNGGNDALNTLVPTDRRYRDARPTLAIPEDELITLAGNDDWGLHPSLALLAPHWEAGTAVFLPGIGFPEPDHSHFVSLDRWWRADDLTSASGWLGRGIAGVDPGPLYATALGGGAPLLRSDGFQAAVIAQPSGFVFPAGLPDW